MAKDKKRLGGAAGKKKNKSVKLGDGIELKVKVGGKGKKGAGKSGAKKSQTGHHSPMDAFARLVESPLVADLIAVGATAAVAAIAEGVSDKSGNKSKSSVKSAGKAAAAAIGRRLMNEYSAIREAGKGAASKPN